MERNFKGIANHRRIEILMLVDKFEGITAEGIANDLEANIKTISEHTRRLVQASLLNGHILKNERSYQIEYI